METHNLKELDGSSQKLEIIRKTQERLIGLDLQAEAVGQEPAIYCTDYFLDLHNDVCVRRTPFGLAGTRHKIPFCVNPQLTALAETNQYLSGRHKLIIPEGNPIFSGDEIYWKRIAKGTGPTGHARRREYPEFQAKPDYALGLLGVWNAKESQELTAVARQNGMRTSETQEIIELSGEKLVGALQNVDVVAPNDQNWQFVHTPYNIQREVEQLEKNKEGNPAIEVRDEGGDRLAAIINLDKERGCLLMQKNAAMLGFEIEERGIDPFAHQYDFPRRLYPDLKILANIGISHETQETVARSFFRVLAHLHLQNASRNRIYNQRHPERPIQPQYKMSDLCFQGRCYDFEASQRLNQEHDFDYYQQQLIWSLKTTAQEIERIINFPHDSLSNAIVPIEELPRVRDIKIYELHSLKHYSADLQAELSIFYPSDELEIDGEKVTIEEWPDGRNMKGGSLSKSYVLKTHGGDLLVMKVYDNNDDAVIALNEHRTLIDIHPDDAKFASMNLGDSVFEIEHRKKDDESRIVHSFGLGKLPDGRSVVFQELAKGMEMWEYLKKINEINPRLMNIAEQLKWGLIHEIALAMREAHQHQFSLLDWSTDKNRIMLATEAPFNMKIKSLQIVDWNVSGSAEFFADDLATMGYLMYKILVGGRINGEDHSRKITQAELPEIFPQWHSLDSVAQNMVINLMCQDAPQKFDSGEGFLQTLEIFEHFWKSENE